MYIGESCGMGYQAQVLRIATILYSTEGASPAGFFDTQVESKWGAGGGSSVGLQQLRKSVNVSVCNVCLREHPFPTS